MNSQESIPGAPEFKIWFQPSTSQIHPDTIEMRMSYPRLTGGRLGGSEWLGFFSPEYLENDPSELGRYMATFTADRCYRFQCEMPDHTPVRIEGADLQELGAKIENLLK